MKGKVYSVEEMVDALTGSPSKEPPKADTSTSTTQEDLAPPTTTKTPEQFLTYRKTDDGAERTVYGGNAFLLYLLIRAGGDGMPNDEWVLVSSLPKTCARLRVKEGLVIDAAEDGDPYHWRRYLRTKVQLMSTNITDDGLPPHGR